LSGFCPSFARAVLRVALGFEFRFFEQNAERNRGPFCRTERVSGSLVVPMHAEICINHETL
jgi:hypothetical protein